MFVSAVLTSFVAICRYPVISGGNDTSLSSVLAGTTSQSALFGSLPASVSAGGGGSEMNREQVLHLIKQLSPVCPLFVTNFFMKVQLRQDVQCFCVKETLKF